MNEVKFGVYDNYKTTDIIIGNDNVKRLRNPTKIIPMECVIDTGKTGPIAWNRPIKSLNGRREFNKLVEIWKPEGY
jgi:hypothetical protein